ncbi:MAG: TonB family protein [Acidobacteriota bacterium]|jgi:TonB family protein
MALREKFGKFVLLEEIDAQHLGVIHRAARLGPAGLDRIVTLLRYSEAVSAHPDAPSRLAQQSRLASRLRIPGLVRVLGIGRVEQSYYASFELLEGRSLRTVIDRARQEGFPFTADNALMVASRAAAALAALHDQKDDAGTPVFHGLIKPSHLVVSWEGDVRMMGYGLWPGLRRTELLGEDDGRYLAPEQRAGQAGDARSDVYALALVLLETLTSGAPGDGDPLEALAAARHTTAAGEEKPLPGEIAEILRRALEPEPASRFAAVEEMRTAIDTLLFSGDFTPTTFNLAFFMHTLFRDDMEGEAVALAEASQADYSEYLPRPDSPSPPAEPSARVPAADERPDRTEAPSAAKAPPAPETSVAGASDQPPAPEPHPPSPGLAPPPGGSAPAPGPATSGPSGSGRRARPTGVRSARPREGTLKVARTSEPKRTGRGLMLLAGLVAAVAVGGGMGYLVLAQRVATKPSAPTLSPDAAAALARVRELETRLAELEREKAEMEAQAESRAESEVESSPPARAVSPDLDAAARARAEARQRARAERARREVEIRRLEEELRTAEESLVEEQRLTSIASESDLAAAFPTLAPPPPTPEPLPPPTTVPPVRAGDLVEAGDPAVTPPVLVGERPARYPHAAQVLRREGSVVVEALVDERGSVRETTVIESTDPGVGFENAATRQVESRRYEPATKSGVPVRVRILIRVNFTLE